MFKKGNPLSFVNNLIDEPFVGEQEGKNTAGMAERVAKILEMDNRDPQKEILAGEIYDEIQQLPVIKEHPYFEPSDIEMIRSEMPKLRPIIPAINLTDEQIQDKIHGAWLGRCAGCLLGKPVEMWDRKRLTGFLKDTGNYPINYYLSSDVAPEIKEKYSLVPHAWINNVECAPADDDTDYTVLALRMMETYGRDFGPEDVAITWLRLIPIFAVNCGGRVAYRNFTDGIEPPRSASFRNPFRDLLGAQIRADFYGYVTLGNPELAVEFAWRDACISHVRNGIYGAMFIAAIISAAAVMNDPEQIIRTGLAYIPEKSRLAESIREVLSWKAEGLTWEQASDLLHERFDGLNFDCLLTTASDMIICIGVLYGEMDFEKSIGITVACAYDTDCNAANVGSVMGMMLGAKALPQKWVAPLNNELITSIAGSGRMKITELASRTFEVWEKAQKSENTFKGTRKIHKDSKASRYLQNIEEGDTAI